MIFVTLGVTSLSDFLYNAPSPLTEPVASAPLSIILELRLLVMTAYCSRTTGESHTSRKLNAVIGPARAEKAYSLRRKRNVRSRSQSVSHRPVNSKKRRHQFSGDIHRSTRGRACSRTNWR